MIPFVVDFDFPGNSSSDHVISKVQTFFFVWLSFISLPKAKKDIKDRKDEKFKILFAYSRQALLVLFKAQ